MQAYTGWKQDDIKAEEAMRRAVMNPNSWCNISIEK